MGTKIDVGYNDVTEFMDIIPNGEYLARLYDVEEDESSSGNPMLVWDFELLEEYPGATVRGWTSLLSHALSETRKYFRAIGMTWKKGDDLERMARKAIKKVKVSLVISTRISRNSSTGEDQRSNKIEGIYPAGKDNPMKKKEASKATIVSDDDEDIPF